MSTDLEASYAESDEVDNPYGFCDKESSFGISRSGGSYLPKSDFGIELVDFVEAKQQTGYCCKITRQVDQQKR